MGRHRNLSENYINKMKEENTRSIGSAITYMMVNVWKAIFIRLAPQRLGGYGRRNRQQMKMAYTPNKVRAISFFWSQFLTFISMFNSLTATSNKYSTLLPSFSFLSSLPSFVLLIAHQSPHPPFAFPSFFRRQVSPRSPGLSWSPRLKRPSVCQQLGLRCVPLWLNLLASL